MAGHSHWAGIKHKKAIIDNKRGKVWSRIAKAIMVAAKMGGGDPDSNPRLRLAMLDARAANMPNDNIHRAIKKGTGELDGGNVEEVLYEGYGPGGVAIMCDIVTDNRNRTAPEIRKVFENNGGKLGATNCVAYLFERKGLIAIEDSQVGEDRLIELALDAGAQDVKHEGERFEVLTSPDLLQTVVDALDAANIPMVSKQLARVPATQIELGIDDARRAMKLLELLDDHDDVQSVSSNASISDETLAVLDSEA